LNALVAEERALQDPWGLTASTSLQSGFYAHQRQADRASGGRPGCELLPTLAICLEGADDPTNARAERIYSADGKDPPPPV
jgi:hypothetical protein